MSDDEIQYVKRQKHLHYGEAQVRAIFHCLNAIKLSMRNAFHTKIKALLCYCIYYTINIFRNIRYFNTCLLQPPLLF